MKITIQVPDDTIDRFTPYVTKNKDLAHVLSDHLRHFAHIPLHERWIHVSPAQRKALEAALGDLPISDGTHLLKRIIAHASVHIGKVQVKLTAGQIREISERAKRNKRSPEAEVDAKIAEIATDYARAV